jgi:hypothetical protein
MMTGHLLRTYRISGSLALLLVVAGCNSTADPIAISREQTVQVPNEPVTARPAPRAPDASNQPRLALDPEGLRWFVPPYGSARPLAFGTAQAAVLGSLEYARGTAARSTIRDCGADPVEYASWSDGLSVAFRAGRFVGWGLDVRARGVITTADGIGIGTTRSQLDDAIGLPLNIRQTSRGTEFSAGGYHGLLDGTGAKARISAISAGVSCVAR